MTLFNLLGEFIQIRIVGIKSYVGESQNWLDISNFVAFVLYLITRVVTGYSADPLYEGDSSTNSALKDFIYLFNVLITFQIIWQYLYLSMIYSKFGLLSKLVLTTITDAYYFTIQLFIFTSIFSMLYRIFGLKVEGTYSNMYPVFEYFTMTFENGLGNIAQPDVSFWLYETGYQYYMVYCIWIIWFLNQMVITIVMLNFLIAVISQTYEDVLSKSLVIKY